MINVDREQLKGDIKRAFTCHIEEVLNAQLGYDIDVESVLSDSSFASKAIEVVLEIEFDGVFDIGKMYLCEIFHFLETTIFEFEALNANPNSGYNGSLTPTINMLQRVLLCVYVIDELEDAGETFRPAALTLEEIALLAGIKVNSARNVVPKEALLDLRSAIDWLNTRPTFKKLRVVDRNAHTDGYVIPSSFFRVSSLIEYVIERARRRGVCFNTLANLIGIEEEKLSEDPQISSELLQAFTKPASWPGLCRFLGLQEESFSEKILESIAEDFINPLRREFQNASKNFQVHGEILDDSKKLDPQVLGELLTSELEAIPHPASTRSNRYLEGYLSKGGNDIAVETTKTPQIWIQAKRYVSGLEEFLVQRYSATTKQSSPYGRHSGLKIYPELAEAEVVKLRVKTIGDAKRVIGILAKEFEA